MRNFLLVAILAACSLSAARAEDCFSLSSQAEMDNCVGRDFKRTDAELNALYGQIQQRLKSDPGTAKLLTTAQRAWLAYRTAECDFASSGTIGGTIHPMVATLCAQKLAESRIADFRTYLNCQEGDTSCPVPAR